jgi:serine/threonine protein phosphatase PrpC
MTRSIGDMIASSVGVICDPGMIEHEITSDSKYIVIASDGIWEFLDNFKVMSMVTPYYLKNDPEGAALQLIHEATQWWDKVKNEFNKSY